MVMMRIVGIDPGLTGAVALLTGDDLYVGDMPTVGNQVSPYGLAILFAEWGQVDRVVIEKQQAYPRQGVSSSFKAGVGYGVLLGVLATLERPVTFVSANTWTKAFGVGADKDKHRRAAMDRWPTQAYAFDRRRDDGRADAALIALWGSTQLHQPSLVQVMETVPATALAARPDG